MRAYALALVAAAVALSAGATPARRTYDTHAYYVFEHDARAGPSPAAVARALGTELVEPAGELRNHWLVRAPHPPVDKRDGADPVLAAHAGARP
jgi:kexin